MISLARIVESWVQEIQTQQQMEVVMMNKPRRNDFHHCNNLALSSCLCAKSGRRHGFLHIQNIAITILRLSGVSRPSR